MAFDSKLPILYQEQKATNTVVNIMIFSYVFFWFVHQNFRWKKSNIVLLEL